MGFSEDAIVANINRSQGTFDTSADGLVALKNAGVSPKVISAMVSKASAIAPTPATQTPAASESAATVQQSTAKQPQTRGYQFGSSAPGQPCAILKRMGPADEVTSHLYAFGIRGKQFQYEGGQLPAAGAHTILVEQTGYVPWRRTVTISPGNDINVNALLGKQPASSTQ